MKIKRTKFEDQSGVSYIELLVVITIIIIVATIGFMQFGTSKEQFKRQNVAMELKTAFERARFDSVKRRVSGTDQNAKVIISANSFTLKTDKNKNGVTTDSGDADTTNFAGQNITITGFESMTLPVTVEYDQRGEVTAIDSSGTPAVVNPIFLVCNGTCNSSNDSSSNANIVLVTPTGTVNLLSGGSAIPAFSPPPITSVPANTAIKNTVTLP